MEQCYEKCPKRLRKGHCENVGFLSEWHGRPVEAEANEEWHGLSGFSPREPWSLCGQIWTGQGQWQELWLWGYCSLEVSGLAQGASSGISWWRPDVLTNWKLYECERKKGVQDDSTESIIIYLFVCVAGFVLVYICFSYTTLRALL